ncbi:DNA (cytosine-5-)-methyltransferase [Sinorhizobium medicae]|nr:DNA (cytosine-5-)-methyltransferase [Sinorhizobium medicae]MDX0580501.1 DNA (cytosine-5-)-methyltransferase [Sinorhizobium medicae]MDX0784125.1 DNA (cytosine-5-)-methyltransferase [Sinorhizobium medicae]
MSEILQQDSDQRNVNLQSRIRKNRASIAKAQFDLISNVEAMRATMPDDDLKLFLVVECGIAKADVAPILAFQETLGQHEALLRKHAVPFTVVRALIVTDSETREAAIEAIEAGDNVDLPRIAALRRSRIRRKLGKDALSERGRRNALVKAAAAHARNSVDAFSEKVATLHDQILEFVDEFIPYPSGDPDVYIPLTSDSFLAAKKEIEEHAGLVLAQFRRIYGEAPPVPGTFTTWRTGTHAQRLAAAAGSLDLFARGKFAWDGGFAFKNDYLFSTEIQDALEYLLPVKLDPKVDSEGSAKGPLKFLEICAGAGGQAIGLMQAGFQPVDLIERDINACKTLRKNWPWPVVRKSLHRLSDFELRQRYHGIDLLAGGVECKAYSRVGKQRGPQDPRNLFDEAIRYVKAIEPRAFFFENVEGFKDDKFRLYRASVYRQLEEAGYDVAPLHDMVGTDFGLAQKRERVVLMGIRKAEGGEISAPVPTKRGITMGDVLKDVLFPYLDQGDPLYDSWASGWLSEHGWKSSRTVLSKLYDPKPKLISDWEDIGFRIDRKRIADGAIKPGSIDLEGVLPYLTIEVIRILQGFPLAWEFIGKNPEIRFAQIGNAFPPQMAKAVGLAIARALSDDLGRADTQPSSQFNATRIGLPPPLRPLPLLNGPDVEFYRMVEEDLRQELRRHTREKNIEKITEFKKHLRDARDETKAAIEWSQEIRRRRRELWDRQAAERAAATAADAVMPS